MFAGTESCIRLVDVDEDGRDDVIFGMTKTDFAGAGDNNIDDMKKTCANAGKYYTETYIYIQNPKEYLNYCFSHCNNWGKRTLEIELRLFFVLVFRSCIDVLTSTTSNNIKHI